MAGTSGDHLLQPPAEQGPLEHAAQDPSGGLDAGTWTECFSPCITAVVPCERLYSWLFPNFRPVLQEIGGPTRCCTEQKEALRRAQLCSDLLLSEE